MAEDFVRLVPPKREQLFERRCVLTVGEAPPATFVQLAPSALKIERLRVTFKVDKSLDKRPNAAEITIFNLNEKSRSALDAKGIRVLLAAGYLQTVAQIFSGDARNIEHRHEGANWITKIQAGDGERAFQFARVSESFKGGVRVADVAKRVVDALQLDPGNAVAQLAGVTEQFVSGYTAHGRAERELERLIEPHGFSFSIQDGRLELLREGETLKQSAVLLSSDTGLIGVPEKVTSEKRNGPGVVKIRSLLQPNIRPGARVVVKSRNINGALRVEKLTHRGDTEGSEWFTEVECTPIT